MGMPIKDLLIDVYNRMSNEDKEFMIQLMAKDIFVAVETLDIDSKDRKTLMYCCELDKEKPVCLNGAMIQLNIDTVITKF